MDIKFYKGFKHLILSFKEKYFQVKLKRKIFKNNFMIKKICRRTNIKQINQDH
jgi:hypothetical protein